MELYYAGIVIAICTFLIIGMFHPIVIKVEYYYGTKPWWLFLLVGIICIIFALFRTFFCHLFLGCLAHHHCGVLVSCLNSAKE